MIIAYAIFCTHHDGGLYSPDMFQAASYKYVLFKDHLVKELFMRTMRGIQKDFSFMQVLVLQYSQHNAFQLLMSH